jgi:hypothetical protein
MYKKTFSQWVYSTVSLSLFESYYNVLTNSLYLWHHLQHLEDGGVFIGRPAHVFNFLIPFV